MTIDHPTLEETIYKEYRTAKRNLRKGRDFADWFKIMRGIDQARNEAMGLAGTNTPQGPLYRAAWAKIDKRERLIDRGRDEKTGKEWEFPTPEDRTFCIKILENYDMPGHDPRRPSIKTWRDALPPGERAKLNHPKRVWQAYWADTEPRAEKDAKLVERERKRAELPKNPMVDALAVAGTETHHARRENEAARELLTYIRDHVELPDDIIVKIDAVLRG
jgi:hypothetical protein